MKRLGIRLKNDSFQWFSVDSFFWETITLYTVHFQISNFVRCFHSLRAVIHGIKGSFQKSIIGALIVSLKVATEYLLTDELMDTEWLFWGKCICHSTVYKLYTFSAVWNKRLHETFQKVVQWAILYYTSCLFCTIVVKIILWLVHMPLELRRYSDRSCRITEPQNRIYCLNFIRYEFSRIFKADTLFIKR